MDRRGFLKLLLGGAALAAGSRVYSFPSILQPLNLGADCVPVPILGGVTWLAKADDVTRLYHAGDVSFVSGGWSEVEPPPWNCRCALLPVSS